MIFTIATTTLNKEVKRKLKTGQYSREEAAFIYMEYLKLKKQRESGTKVAGISMAVIWGLMLVLPLLSGRGLVLPLSRTAPFSTFFIFATACRNCSICLLSYVWYF